MSRGVTDYVEQERERSAGPALHPDPDEPSGPGASGPGAPAGPERLPGPGGGPSRPRTPGPGRLTRRRLWTGAAQASALWGATRLALIGFVLLLSWIEGLDQDGRTRDWLAASRRLWWVAGLMAAAAVSIRINGLFLLVALVLMYLLQLRADRRWRPRADALALLLPVVPLTGIAVWLHHSTGSWNAWQEAEAKGWGRQTAWPWQGLADGWHEITTQHGPHILIASLAAFATVVLGLVLIPVLAWLRRWPELLFMVLNVLVLVCSTTFVSAPRYALTWFPAFILAAELTGRVRLRWLHPVLLIACLPLEATLFLLYARHFWVA